MDKKQPPALKDKAKPRSEIKCTGVSNKVRLQVMSECGGMCCHPECSKLLYQEEKGSLVGECAHIISRNSGGPRNDDRVSQKERNQAHNLLYLCLEHHKIVDDLANINKYTAETLRKWKNDRKEYMDRISKNINPSSQTLIRDIRKANNQDKSFKDILKKMLLVCRDLIYRNRLTEAEILFSQISIFISGLNDSELIIDYQLIRSLFYIKEEKIKNSKEILLELAQEFPNNIELMFEYIEICNNFPESSDKNNEFEQKFRQIDPENPRILLIALERMYINKQKFDENVSISSIDNLLIKSKFLRICALLAYDNGEKSKSEILINEWENQQPDSTKPHLIRTLFKISDLLNNQTLNPDKLMHGLDILQEVEKKIALKNPLHIREKIALLTQEFVIYRHLLDYSTDVPDLNDMHNSIIDLIEKCYFNPFINDTLERLLPLWKLNVDYWRKIISNILHSKCLPSNKLIELLFLQAIQHSILKEELCDFIKKTHRNDLTELITSISNKNPSDIANLLNVKNDTSFSLAFLAFLEDKKLVINLKGLINIEQDNIDHANFIYAEALIQNGMASEALELIDKIPLERISFCTLFKIEKLAYEYNYWDLFIKISNKIIKSSTKEDYNTYIHAKLAIAYHCQSDDSNAVQHAEKALDKAEYLDEQIAQKILVQIVNSIELMKSSEAACDIYSKYSNIKRTFSMAIAESQMYIQSDLENKFDKAVSILLNAFYSLKEYKDEVFAKAFHLINELNNFKNISLESEKTITENLFFQISGLENWFYIGEEEKKLDAIFLAPNTDNYGAIINKNLQEEFFWPANKFSSPDKKRKITYVLSPIAYLVIRCQVAMNRVADLGTASIWKISLADETGQFNSKNLIKFLKESSQRRDNFFETFKNSLLPISFLCQSEGNIFSAMRRITSEQKGFVFCNNTKPEDWDRQLQVAKEALTGKPCFLDGFTALILVRANILELVIKSVPNLCTPASTMRLLREIAKEMYTSDSHLGSLNIENGSLQYSKTDKAAAEAFRKKLIEAANLLDNSERKYNLKRNSKSSNENKLDNVLPPYFTDTFRLAQENNVSVLTDDGLLNIAYTAMGENKLPEQFSSISLIQQMRDTGLCSWADYLNYFSLLCSYRYCFLSISADDLKKSMTYSSPGGIISISPKNLLKFNLEMTLSQSYGIDDLTAIEIIAEFFKMVILDDSIIAEVSKEIFDITIVKSLQKRYSKILLQKIFQKSTQEMQFDIWLTSLSKLKIEILRHRLLRFEYISTPPTCLMTEV